MRIKLNPTQSQIANLEEMFNQANRIVDIATEIATEARLNFTERRGYFYLAVSGDSRNSEEVRQQALAKYKQIEAEAGYTGGDLKKAVRSKISIMEENILLPLTSVDSLCIFVLDSTRFSGAPRIGEELQIMGAKARGGKPIAIHLDTNIMVISVNGKPQVYELGDILTDEELDKIVRVALGKNKQGKFVAIGYGDKDNPIEDEDRTDNWKMIEFPIIADTIGARILNDFIARFVMHRMIAFREGRRHRLFDFSKPEYTIAEKIMPYLYATGDQSFAASALLDAQRIHRLAVTEPDFNAEDMLSEQIIRVPINRDADKPYFQPFLNSLHTMVEDERFCWSFEGLFPEYMQASMAIIEKKSNNQFVVRFQ